MATREKLESDAKAAIELAVSQGVSPSRIEKVFVKEGLPEVYAWSKIDTETLERLGYRFRHLAKWASIFVFKD
jgi:hypothetical protein